MLTGHLVASRVWSLDSIWSKSLDIPPFKKIASVQTHLHSFAEHGLNGRFNDYGRKTFWT